MFFVPAWEGCEEEESDEGENDCGNAEEMSVHEMCYLENVKTHIRYGNTTLFLKVLATQIKLSGSWSMLICSANNVALFEHKKLPPSGFTHSPKYPTRTSRFASPTMLAMAAVTPGLTCVGSYVGVYIS